jgi:hypothetical protein
MIGKLTVYATGASSSSKSVLKHSVCQHVSNGARLSEGERSHGSPSYISWEICRRESPVSTKSPSAPNSLYSIFPTYIPSPSEVMWSRYRHIDWSNQHHVMAPRRKQREGCGHRRESLAWRGDPQVSTMITGCWT